MKFGIFLLSCAFVLLTDSARAAPVEEETAGKNVMDELEIFGRHVGTGELVRIRRASCDLFSFSSKWVTPNNAVCAAHCIALGNRGGSCKGPVCHCRK